MKILAIGDIVGRPGRRAVAEFLPGLMTELEPDFVIANAENASGGAGINQETAAAIFEAGVDALTMGNHVWSNRDSYTYIESEIRLVRPANYPEGAPGRGYQVLESRAGIRIGLLNLLGRTFMQAVDDPFAVGQHAIEDLQKCSDVIVVDMHAEATSEKMAFAWFVDGQVACVFGTHTHVPTADEQVLEGGTAYITDVGMTGPRNSIIGMRPAEIIERFRTGLPTRFEVAKGPTVLNAILVDVDEGCGLARSIERVQRHSR